MAHLSSLLYKNKKVNKNIYDIYKYIIFWKADHLKKILKYELEIRG